MKNRIGERGRKTIGSQQFDGEKYNRMSADVKTKKICIENLPTGPSWLKDPVACQTNRQRSYQVWGSSRLLRTPSAPCYDHHNCKQRCQEGYNLELIADKVSSVMEIDALEICKSGKSRRRVAARSLFCFWAVRELGVSMTELSRRLNLSLTGVSQSVIRGEKIAETNGYELLEK